jgi:hypothetical protein
LEVALDGTGTRTIVVKSAIGQTFDKSADLVIGTGGTTAEQNEMSSVKTTTTAHASGTLATALDGTGTTTVVVKSAIGQTFDTSADLVIGTGGTTAAQIGLASVTPTTTAHASGTLSTALNGVATSVVFVTSAVGQIFDQTADLFIGTDGTTVGQSVLSAVNSTTTAGAVSTVTVKSAIGQTFNTLADLVIDTSTIVSLLDLSSAISTTTAHASGTLVAALDGTGTTTVVVRSAIGQLFDKTANLVIGTGGGTEVAQINLSSVISTTTAHAAGILWVALASSGSLNIKVQSITGQIFDTTANLTIGTTTIQKENLVEVTSWSKTYTPRTSSGLAVDDIHGWTQDQCSNEKPSYSTDGSVGAWGSEIYLHTDQFIHETIPLSVLNSLTWEKKVKIIILNLCNTT